MTQNRQIQTFLSKNDSLRVCLVGRDDVNETSFQLCVHLFQMVLKIPGPSVLHTLATFSMADRHAILADPSLPDTSKTELP